MTATTREWFMPMIAESIQRCHAWSRRRLTPHLRLLEGLLFAGYLAFHGRNIIEFGIRRPLWYDELFTLYLARVSSIPDLLGHLAAGVDLNPPLMYILTGWSIRSFGEAEWAVRLPSLAAMFFGLTCFYLFLRRRLPVLSALLGVTIAAAPVKVWTYFFEARPYSLLFAWSALALLCWQRCQDGPPRRLWLAGLAAAAALGMCTHYFFAVPLAALGCAELFRWYAQKKIDPWPMAALAAGGIMLLACYPLWSQAPRQYSEGFWAKAQFDRAAIESVYMSFFDKTVQVPAAISLAAAAIGWIGWRRPSSGGFTRPEIAGLVALCAGPLAGLALGAFVTGGFHNRYVIPSALGFAALFAALLHRATPTPWPTAVALIAFLAINVADNAWEHRQFFAYEKEMVLQNNAFLSEHAPGGLVAIETGYEFGRAWHYDIERRYEPYFLADAERALHYSKVDTTERALILLQRVMPVPLATSTELIARMKAGQNVYYYGQCSGWAFQDLTASGVRFEPVAEQSTGTLYRLSVK